jgi:hypothetical protein
MGAIGEGRSRPYSAPANAGTYKVKAVSNVDPAKIGLATAHVVNPTKAGKGRSADGYHGDNEGQERLHH